MAFTPYTEPTDWHLEIDPAMQALAWQQSRSLPTLWGQWNAYLNQLCLETCLQELRHDYLPDAHSRMRGDLPQLWDGVNGSLIGVDNVRLALIPTDEIDHSELVVPQEWVDIPSWVADYYLAVQVDSDQAVIRIAGYVTHRQLKERGYYDSNDRTYCLDTDRLTTDLNALWLSYAHYTADQVKTVLMPLATLSTPQADQLIQRLGTANELMPRLEVPFAMWGALLDNPAWRRRLFQQRQTGNPAPLATRLSNWLQGQFEAGWQSATDWLTAPPVAAAMRSAASQEDRVCRVKHLTFGEGQLDLMISLAAISDTEVRIELQVRPTEGTGSLPNATEVKLLTGEDMVIGQASATITETIRLQFRANYQEAFQIEITCNQETITERVTV